MPRGPAPGWRRRMEPILDDHVLASVAQAGGIGQHHPVTGHYATLIIRGLASKDEAAEWKRALHRSAHYLARHNVADVSMSASVRRDGTKWLIEFRVIDKTIARNYILQQYGPDRSKWPYDPRRRGGD